MIRAATLADLPACVALGEEFAKGTPYGRYIPVNTRQFAQLGETLITASAGVIAVSECDGQITGMLGAMVGPHFMSGQPYCGEVFWWMTPTARGDGVKLLRWVERWAREQGATWLQMIAPDERVGRFYQRDGFEALETTYARHL